MRRLSFPTLTQIALAALVALAAGCTPTFATPPGFVELEDSGPYSYRATTADGLVIAGRELDNDPEGDLAFWTRAVENQLRYGGGYALLEKRTVKNKTGHTGTELRFGHDQDGQPYLYYLALFVSEDSIYVVEAGGSKRLVERGESQIAWAVQNVRVD